MLISTLAGLALAFSDVQDSSYDEAETVRIAEEAARQAAENAEEKGEAIMIEQKLFETRLEICRIATKRDKWVEFVESKIKQNPEIGPLLPIVRTCTAYLQGRLDQLDIEVGRN